MLDKKYLWLIIIIWISCTIQYSFQQDTNSLKYFTPFKETQRDKYKLLNRERRQPARTCAKVENCEEDRRNRDTDGEISAFEQGSPAASAHLEGRPESHLIFPQGGGQRMMIQHIDRHSMI